MVDGLLVVPSIVTLAQYVRSRRLERGDTQKQAATAVGVDALTWGRWERGQIPTLRIVFKLADYLGCKVDALRPYVEKAA